MLTRIEVDNFKSYKGHQVIGPFSPFSCVIGPNGAGKSNLMDAISFVLGVRSAQLRSTQLKDLIYRAGSLAEDDAMDVDGDELQIPKTASVVAVYEDKTGHELRFQRSISASGASEYKINGQTMTYAKYNAVLEKHNILVKAKNFLVFQGDVEAVAQQAPKDLVKLIEQISGSGELKDEYDQFKVRADKASENSTAAFNKRKGFNTEIKQFKEQKAEAIRFDQLREARDGAVVKHCVWKLHHLEKSIQDRQNQIKDKGKAIKQLKAQQSEHEAKLKAARKEQHKAQKEVAKKEKELKKREQDYDDRKPALLELETQIAHSMGRIQRSEALATKLQPDRDAHVKTLKQYEKDLALTQKAARQHAEEARKASQKTGLTLSDNDLTWYRTLRAEASKRAVSERQQLEKQTREARSKRDILNGLQDQLEQAQHSRQAREDDAKTLDARKEETANKVKRLQEDLAAVKRRLHEAQAERTKANQLQTELNEKLQECIQKLMQAGADRHESEREAKLKETVAGLQRSMPSKVLGRVMDLIKPTQRKYDTALAVVLGRHIDSIVVDTEATAAQCITDIRNSRSGTATFLPLDLITVKPVNDKFRSYSKNARLAIDVVTYDPSLEKAMQFVCGSAMICDTIETAKFVCFDKGQEVKAVTLDGTVFHKTGLITGGAASASGGRKWEEAQVQGLKKLEESLRTQLKELSASRPRQSVDDVLISDINRLETELTVAKDDLSATKSRSNGVRAELSTLVKKIQDLAKQVDRATTDHDSLAASIAKLSKTIEEAEADIFDDFCASVGIKNIKEYEESAFLQAQAEGEATLKFTTQISRLTHQIEFEREQLALIDERLKKITDNAAKERATLGTREKELQRAQEELQSIETELEGLREELKSLEDEAAAKAQAAEMVKKSSGKSMSAFQKAQKEISTWNDDLEKFASERFAVYRRCKLEEIDLPLKQGDLADVPLEEHLREAMALDDEEDASMQAVDVSDYGIEVDFGQLDEDEEADASPEMETKLQAAITKLTDEIQRMTPNMKATSKLDEVENKLAATDKDFDAARREAKEAKDAFAAIRKKRTDLFNKAYSHISDNIDVVYKELTKGKASPMGGVAYLSLEDSEEPYLHGIKYHAMPPMKRFRDMDQLSGGEKTMAALALLFAVHSFSPSPFFVLDEVDAALDNTNVSRIANYVKQQASEDFQFIVISLKGAFYEKAQGLVGIWRDVEGGSSKTLTLDLSAYA